MSAFPRTAMILAAGLGMRMRPLTERMPKPLVEVAGKALLDWALDALVEAEVTQAVVNVSYKAQMIEEHLKARRDVGIIISREATPLETGGGITHALGQLGGDVFFSLNADVIVRSSRTHYLRRLWEKWDARRMDALLLVHPVDLAVGYDGPGDFFLQQDGKLAREAGQEAAPYVFTGVQVLHPRLFEGAPDTPFSMNVLYEKLMRQGRLCGLAHDGQFLHVGDMAGLAAAERALKG